MSRINTLTLISFRIAYREIVYAVCIQFFWKFSNEQNTWSFKSAFWTLICLEKEWTRKRKEKYTPVCIWIKIPLPIFCIAIYWGLDNFLDRLFVLCDYCHSIVPCVSSISSICIDNISHPLNFVTILIAEMSDFGENWNNKTQSFLIPLTHDPFSQ